MTLSPATTTDVSSVSSAHDYWRLMKPGVLMLVVFTGAVGLALAPASLHPVQQFCVLLAIAMGSGGAGAINMWYDRDIDGLMDRTATRPIPSGRVEADDALGFGIFLSGFSVALMGLAANWLAAGLLAFSIIFYAVIYTMLLKRFTSQNIVIGGAAGAFPPMIGWLAATGNVSTLPVILFLITFLWTPPHFWALALVRSKDYANVNVPMMPVIKGERATKWQMLFYTLLLTAVVVSPIFIGLTVWVYEGVAIVLSAIFIWHNIRVLRRSDQRAPMAMFGFSIFYLFALYSAFWVDHILNIATW